MEKQCKNVSLPGMGMLLWVVTLVTLLWCGTGFAHAPDTLWTRTYGGASGDFGESVQQIPDGGYIIAGYTGSFGAGSYDVYFIKTNTGGDTVWTKTYGGIDDDRGYSVQRTSDGGYIIAGYTCSFGAGSYDVYLIKTNASGDTIWTKTYGGMDDDRGYSVQRTSDGGYIIAGHTQSFGAGGYDVYLIKTNAGGDTVWTKTYGGASGDFGESVQQATDGGYIIAGYTESLGAGSYDVYLIKTNADGDAIWTKTCGGEGSDIGLSVQKTSFGGYIVVGYTGSFGAGQNDVYLVKTASTGATVWTKTYGGIWGDVGISVQETSDGGYIVTGYTYSFGPTFGDVYLVKTAANGDTLWTMTYGGTDYDRGSSVQETSDGGYIIAGYTESFGAGGNDLYLVKIAPDVAIEEKESLQKVFFISRCEPNPFRDRTSIRYELSKSSNVHITIYNLLGQDIRTLVDMEQNGGMHTAIWDGRDNDGRRVSSGPYFLRFTIRSIGGSHTGLGIHAGLATQEYTATRKLFVVR